MSLIFIIDDACTPARYGVTASLWANQQDLPLYSLRPTFAGDVPDSHQHVIRAGYCVTSGLYLSDTLQEEVTEVAHLPTQDAVIVLSAAQSDVIASLPGERFYSHDRGDRLELRAAEDTALLVQADRYGRWASIPTSDIGRVLRIGLVGRAADHREVYPATLAALGDAARALNVTLDIRFLPPAELSSELHELNGLHGVVLPGGSSMAAVTGQIHVAESTLQSRLPTLGLCLGMQSMATAGVRQNLGCEQAILAEVAPGAPLHSFIPFKDGQHRCGILPFTSTQLPGSDSTMHYNHRYHFNPTLLPQLIASGVQVSAQTDDIVEAVSRADLPFWHGVQGHPELSSRPDAPHPLISAFLLAAISSPA